MQWGSRNIPGKLVSKKPGTRYGLTTTAKAQQPRSVACSERKNTKENKDKVTEARKEYNHAEKEVERRYNNKLKKEL